MTRRLNLSPSLAAAVHSAITAVEFEAAAMASRRLHKQTHGAPAKKWGRFGPTGEHRSQVLSLISALGPIRLQVEIPASRADADEYSSLVPMVSPFEPIRVKYGAPLSSRRYRASRGVQLGRGNAPQRSLLAHVALAGQHRLVVVPLQVEHVLDASTLSRPRYFSKMAHTTRQKRPRTCQPNAGPVLSQRLVVS